MKEKIKFIKELAKSLNEYNVGSIEYENDNFNIKIKKRVEDKTKIVLAKNDQIFSGAQTMPVNQPVTEVIQEAAKPQEEEIKGTKVESPMVGTFYSAPSPGASSFVKEGDQVKEGETLCIVEAMKLMNEIKAPASGTIKKINAKDAMPIKKGDVLMIIE